MNPSNAYLCVRALDEEGCPVVGEGWTCEPQDGGWYVLRHRSGHVIAAWKANTVSTRALFALFGERQVLDAIADAEPLCMPAKEAWDRRSEANVRTFLRRWRHWRLDGHVRDHEGVAQPVVGAVVQLVPEGSAIPDPTTTPLPWLLRADGTVTTQQAQASVRVAALHQPALDRTIAGFVLHQQLEDEPARA